MGKHGERAGRPFPRSTTPRSRSHFAKCDRLPGSRDAPERTASGCAPSPGGGAPPRTASHAWGTVGERVDRPLPRSTTPRSRSHFAKCDRLPGSRDAEGAVSRCAPSQGGHRVESEAKRGEPWGNRWTARSRAQRRPDRDDTFQSVIAFPDRATHQKGRRLDAPRP